MITPQQYESWPESLIELAQELEEYVIEDILRRLAKEGRVTATAYAQSQSLLSYSGWTYERIRERIASTSGLLGAEIDAVYQKALEQMQADYGGMIGELGKPSQFLSNVHMQNLLRAEAIQTAGTFKKLTGSLGFSFELSGNKEWIPIEKIYQRSLDYVITQAQSGAVTIDQAIRQATIKLADSGLKTIDYASGHSNHIDVAVRRAAVTGMHQISGKLSELAIDELGTNLVEVSAHQGARDKGTVPENHKLWQGKVYWWRTKGGEEPKGDYRDFITTTGYNTGPGLKGWECRHDFGPFVEGVSQRIWPDEQLANIDPPAFEYEGRIYKADEAIDRQREIERNIRRFKRRMLGLEATGLDQHNLEYQRNAGLLHGWEREYRKFSGAAGLRTQMERAHVVGYSNGQAARTRSAANKKEQTS